MSFREEILVICGPMRSGKSNHLILQLEKLKYAKIPYLVFKPDIDRYENKISTRYLNHSEEAISISSKDARQILEYVKSIDFQLPFTIAVDEAQFFDKSIVDVVRELSSKGINFIISGLDLDAAGRPFGSVGDLLALATRVRKLTSVCERCCGEATKTGLKVADPNFLVNNIKVHDLDTYISLCSKCFYQSEKIG